MSIYIGGGLGLPVYRLHSALTLTTLTQSRTWLETLKDYYKWTNKPISLLKLLATPLALMISFFHLVSLSLPPLLGIDEFFYSSVGELKLSLQFVGVVISFRFMWRLGQVTYLLFGVLIQNTCLTGKVKTFYTLHQRVGKQHFFFLFFSTELVRSN